MAHVTCELFKRIQPFLIFYLLGHPFVFGQLLLGHLGGRLGFSKLNYVLYVRNGMVAYDGKLILNKWITNLI